MNIENTENKPTRKAENTRNSGNKSFDSQCTDGNALRACVAIEQGRAARLSQVVLVRCCLLHIQAESPRPLPHSKALVGLGGLKLLRGESEFGRDLVHTLLGSRCVNRTTALLGQPGLGMLKELEMLGHGIHRPRLIHIAVEQFSQHGLV